jgi:hypothetical protein
VKGEIEATDKSGEPQTLFNWQRNVPDVPAVIDAVRECAHLVATYDVR